VSGPPTFCGPPAETEEGIGALTLPGLLAETAARHAGREACCFHGPGGRVSLTYAELAAQAGALARGLAARGVGPHDRVALLMGNRPEWVVAAFGVTATGAVLVPLNTYYEPPELAYVLGHSGVGVLVCQRDLAGHPWLDQVTAMRAELPALRTVVVLDPPPGRPDVVAWGEVVGVGTADGTGGGGTAGGAAVGPDDPAVAIYTSGTTAHPKGVLHAHRAPALQSWRFARELALDPTCRVWSAFPFFWTAGFCMVMGATLAAGGCLVLQERFEPGEALRLLEAERVTTPHAWPHQAAQLEDHPDWARRDLSSIRQAEAFGSFGRHPTVRLSDAWSPRSAYGLSETFTIVSSWPARSPPEEREGHQGRILPGNCVRIIDPDTGAALPAGAEGEIAVRGPTLMLGYVGVPPAATFDADGFFRTGDAGWVDEAGRLHWTGRADELIKTGGANVSPVEVEEALLRHPGLKAAVAVGVPDPLLGEVVVVCAVPHAGAAVGEDDVRAFLRGRLAGYKIPRHVLFVDEADLSFTGNRKIRARELRRLAAARLGRPAPG
jgi:acyl-CoA synthetase (AMP-forming)/AMP-acid ligase II